MLERSKLENLVILMGFMTQFPSGTFQLDGDSATLCVYIVHMYYCTVMSKNDCHDTI